MGIFSSWTYRICAHSATVSLCARELPTFRAKAKTGGERAASGRQGGITPPHNHSDCAHRRIFCVVVMS